MCKVDRTKVDYGTKVQKCGGYANVSSYFFNKMFKKV